jgi:hypothetical protein
MWSRIHLIPVLQAEEDRDQVRRYLADQAREKELLGENLKVYHTDRFVLIMVWAWGAESEDDVGWIMADLRQIRAPDVRCHARGCDEIDVAGIGGCKGGGTGPWDWGVLVDAVALTVVYTYVTPILTVRKQRLYRVG